MEFCPGGDFFTHLKQIKILTEDQARIYFLYILVDLNGNCKIADFGLSKLLEQDEFSYSFCGSSE